MAKGLLDQGIQPQVTLSLAINRDYEKREEYKTAGTNKDTDGEQVTRSGNYLLPQLGLGLGGFTFYSADAFKAIVDLDYNLRVFLYDNEYSYQKTPTGKYEIDKIKGLFAGVVGSYTENTQMQNWIAPSLKLAWKSEDSRLALKSKLGLAVTLTNFSSTGYTYVPASSAAKQNGADTKQFIFQFQPGLDLAAQYQIIPEKLTLSIGGSIGVTAIRVISVESETYTAGTANPHSKTKTTTPSFGTGTTTDLKAAVTWNLTKNVFVEGSTGVGTSNGASDVHLIGNVIQFTSILAGLKF
jgi:hypothetical protein